MNAATTKLQKMSKLCTGVTRLIQDPLKGSHTTRSASCGHHWKSSKGAAALVSGMLESLSKDLQAGGPMEVGDPTKQMPRGLSTCGDVGWQGDSRSCLGH